MSKLKQSKGFTLIELVIVLAIAALILAAVLIAVGGAQRSQRDGARKNIAGRLSSAIQNFASNNNGSITAFACGTYCAGITDPDTGAAPAAGTAATATSGVVYNLGKNCAGTAGGRLYSIYYWSENGGTSQCIDNS